MKKVTKVMKGSVEGYERKCRMRFRKLFHVQISSHVYPGIMVYIIITVN